MNWDMIGALAELLGAAGVIITLVYLATQIRQSTLESRRKAVHDVASLSDGLLGDLASDNELAGLFLRGLSRPEDLTPVEQLRFSSLMLRTVTMWQEQFQAEKAGYLPDWVSRQGQSWEEICTHPGFRWWYERRGHWIHEDFRAALEARMDLTAEHPEWYEKPRLEDRETPAHPEPRVGPDPRG